MGNTLEQWLERLPQCLALDIGPDMDVFTGTDQLALQNRGCGGGGYASFHGSRLGGKDKLEAVDYEFQ